MTIIKTVLLVLFTSEVSFSSPLKVIESNGPVIDLMSLGLEKDSSNAFLQTENEKNFQILKPDSKNDDGTLLVIQGKAAARELFPYQVGIIKQNSDGKTGFLNCGGSLISPNYVLSAAHCFHGDSPLTRYVADIGGVDMEKSKGIKSSSPGEEGRTFIPFFRANVTIHANYETRYHKNDIAIIKLPETVSISKYANVVKLPTKKEAENETIFDESVAVLSGWGLVKSKDTTTPRFLQFGNLVMMNQSECAKKYRTLNNYQLTPDQQCAKVTSFTKSNSCRGDSGGPLVVLSFNVRMVLVGVVSLGHNDCELGFPSVYVRVSYFLDWIAKHSDVKIE